MADVYKLFAARLRERRQRLDMTQRELADILGYSEKTVSKWESGTAIAPSAVLPMLATVLKTDVNYFLLGGESCYYLGIDGGGTKTEFALSDEGGRIVRNITLEGSNPVDVGFTKAREILTRGISEILGDISTSTVYCFAGIAGGITGTNKERIRALLSEFGFADFDNGSDAQNAVAASIGDNDGTVVIMGTGTVAFTKNQKRLCRHGGWGYLFEEGGSGFSIGRDAIMHTLATEEAGRTDPLSDSIRKMLGKGALDSLGTIYDSGKRYVASLATAVFELCDLGDPTATAILDKNMSAIARLIESAESGGKKQTVVITGGLSSRADVLLPMIARHLKNEAKYELCIAGKRPIYGALRLAKELKGDTPC